MTSYTHGHDETVLVSHRSRTAASSAAYLLPHLRPGQHLLDVGCGPATITADLAALIAPGSVTATELNEHALDIARAELDRRRVHAELLEADVHDLPFDDGSFDVVHAHQVLQHVADPVRALTEMRRVCRPGGIVAVRDSDYAAFNWWPMLPELDDWLRMYRTAAKANGAEPDAGRRLLGWAQAAGFEDITPGASVWLFATPETRAWWGDMWAGRILRSAIADQLRREGVADETTLLRISHGWRAWAAAADGWLTVPHGELICRA